MDKCKKDQRKLPNDTFRQIDMYLPHISATSKHDKDTNCDRIANKYQFPKKKKLIGSLITNTFVYLS